MTKQTIEVKGLPEGWKAISYRSPKKGEHYFYSGRIECAHSNYDIDTSFPRLIVKKIQPRRIVLEETGRVGKPAENEYVQHNGNFCKCRKPERWGNEHEIWREVRENDIPLTNAEPKLSLSVAECKEAMRKLETFNVSDLSVKVHKFIKENS